MNARQFFDRVALLRRHQKDYFRHRRKSDLDICRHLEREIDNEIERVKSLLGEEDQTPEQRRLFDRG